MTTAGAIQKLMANPDGATTLAQFSAIVRKTKNRLVAIPAVTWRASGPATASR